ncbi:hypothetical protein PCASD_18869 [Puccinia coronata f. sp. avenae]|uniref:Uncharacterized protein n=1 Tax=Puccinia coronata f. sp. avenae TaxID=200324 RepID=A0A2N5UD13_9BASI|nr:hypothetical protein PCASD_18869 [Puccinia coronata f. sp. avenae]
MLSWVHPVNPTMTPSSQMLSTSPGQATIPPALGPLRFLMPSDETACTSCSHSHSYPTIITPRA